MKTPRLVAIAWTAGSAFLSRMIRRFDFATVDGHRVDAAINHVLVRFEFENGPDMIAEALLDRGFTFSPFSHLLGALDDGRVLRLVEYELDPGAAARAWKRCALMHGKGYDVRLLVLYLMWSRYFGKNRVGSFLFGLDNPNRMTCNEAAVAALEGLVPAIPYGTPKTYTPEGLFQAVVGIPSPTFVAQHMGDGQAHILVDGSTKGYPTRVISAC